MYSLMLERYRINEFRYEKEPGFRKWVMTTFKYKFS